MAWALVAAEGFDSYSAIADMDDYGKWPYTGLSFLITTTGGRDSGGALHLQFTQNSSAQCAQLKLGASYNALLIGAAVKLDSATGDRRLFGPQNGGYTNSVMIEYDDSAGHFEIVTGVGTPILGTGTKNISRDVWYYLELYVYYDGTNGRAVLKVNGVTDIDYTGAVVGDSITAAQVIFQNNYLSGNQGSLVDDIYVMGDTTSTEPTYLGDVRVISVVPDANGTNRDFTPSTGTDDYAVLDEQPVSMTDYMYDITSGSKLSVGMENIDTSFNVLGVVAQYTTDVAAGPRDYKPLCRSNGTDYLGSAITSTGPLMNWAVYETDPDTGLAWDAADLNAAEFGVELQ